LKTFALPPSETCAVKRYCRIGLPKAGIWLARRQPSFIIILFSVCHNAFAARAKASICRAKADVLPIFYRETNY
jgi:hypothetical protein